MHVWKKSQRSNAIIILLALISFTLKTILLLCSRTKSKGCFYSKRLGTIVAQQGSSFTHLCLLAWQSLRTQYNTAQTGNTCQAVFGVQGKLNDCAHQEDTSITALLFIAVSLPYLTEADWHACFPGLGHDEESIPTSNAGVLSCF